MNHKTELLWSIWVKSKAPKVARQPSKGLALAESTIELKSVVGSSF